MFEKTYMIDALDANERLTETFTGTYFQMNRRVTAIRKHGFIIQSITKH